MGSCVDVQEPGPGLLDGWYDFAMAAQTVVRKASLAYTLPIYVHPPHVMIGKKARTDPIHAEGMNEKIAVQCGWADIAYLGAEFPQAVVLKKKDQCATSHVHQLEKVLRGEATSAAMFTINWQNYADKAIEGVEGFTGKYSEHLKKIEDASGTSSEWELIQTRALMTSKRNLCKTRAFNKGLQAIQRNGKLEQICPQDEKCCGIRGNVCNVDYNGFHNDITTT
eukprot:NODE_617_length_882_cov_1185.691477_g408_i0.p2 GENE.NODE_617_length_882_cov_1185.691477_g408_i0~~NODE_617_length_882_cov_1185.691477_g408_i0.p2  ORF type:complete len:232 (+),score=71.87 NODE_617_length_882_cov_1185.691477_g408_i0:30-698(+)